MRFKRGLLGGDWGDDKSREMYCLRFVLKRGRSHMKGARFIYGSFSIIMCDIMGGPDE